MLKLKNISGQVQQIHTYEFPVDGEYEIDNSWYIPQVIEALVNNVFELYLSGDLIEDLDKKLDALKGDVRRVKIDGPQDSEGLPLTRSAAFSDALGFRFRGKSLSGTAVKEQTTDIDFYFTETLYINGGQVILDSRNPEDTLTVQVIDKDNILGLGANTVLDEFISEYFIPTEGLLEISLAYPAKINQGLYLRFKYTNTETVDKSIKFNLYLHLKVPL